ncbi:phosphopantothenoylcysteine decarboxylase domain-containing protein, partial [Limosilactobacillus reuteri]
MPPVSGRLAEGYAGRGRWTRTQQQFANISEDFLASSRALKGKHVIVTAGGTRENIDPVRFIGNESAPLVKWGLHFANAAVQAGAKVTLIAGQVTVPLP